MSSFEYRIVPAPRKAKRVRGAKTPQERFAALLTETVNAEARAGWEFVRAESLPHEERKGMLSQATEAYHSYLVFRRPVGGAQVADPGSNRPAFPLAERTRQARAQEQQAAPLPLQPQRTQEPRPPQARTTETPLHEPRFKFQPPRRDDDL